jgi:hypothetical protein
MAASNFTLDPEETTIPIELDLLEAMLPSLEETFAPAQRIRLINNATGLSLICTLGELLESKQSVEDYHIQMLRSMDSADIETKKKFFKMNPDLLYQEIGCAWLQSAINKNSKPELAAVFSSYLELGASPSMQLPIVSTNPLTLAEGIFKYNVINETLEMVAKNKSHFTKDEYDALKELLSIDDKFEFENALSLLEVVLYYCRSYLRQGMYTTTVTYERAFTLADLAADLFSHIDKLCAESVNPLGEKNQGFRLLEQIYQHADLLPFENDEEISLQEKVLFAWQQGIFILSDQEKIHILALAAEMGARTFRNLWEIYRFRPSIPPKRDPSKPDLNPADILSTALFRAYEKDDSDLVWLLLGSDGSSYPTPSSPLGCGLLDINSRDASQNTLLSLCEARVKQDPHSLQNEDYPLNLPSAKLLLRLGASPWLVPIDSVSPRIQYMPLYETGRPWIEFFLAFYQRLKGDILAQRYQVTLMGKAIVVRIDVAGHSYRCPVPSGVARIFKWMEYAARYHVLYNTRDLYETILTKLSSIVDVVRSSNVTELYFNFIYLFNLNAYSPSKEFYNYENSLSSNRRIHHPEELHNFVSAALKHIVVFSPSAFSESSTESVPISSSSPSTSSDVALINENFSSGLRLLMELGVCPSAPVKIGADLPRPFLSVLKASGLLEKGEGAYWLEGLMKQERDDKPRVEELHAALGEMRVLPNFFNQTLQVSINNRLSLALAQLFSWQHVSKIQAWQEELIRVFTTFIVNEELDQCLIFLAMSREYNSSLTKKFIGILAQYSAQLQRWHGRFLVEVACQYDAPQLIQKISDGLPFALDKIDAVLIESKSQSGLASILHLAVFHRAVNMVKWLLEQNIDPNIYSRTWGTALHIIAAKFKPMQVTPKQSEWFEIMRCLGLFGASPWIRHRGYSSARVISDTMDQAHIYYTNNSSGHLGGELREYVYDVNIRNEKMRAYDLSQEIKNGFILDGKLKISDLKQQQSFLKIVLHRMEGDIMSGRYPAPKLESPAIVTINQRNYSIPSTLNEIYIQLQAWRDDRIEDMDRSVYSRVIERIGHIKNLLRSEQLNKLYRHFIKFLKLNAPFPVEFFSESFEREAYDSYGSSEEDGIDEEEGSENSLNDSDFDGPEECHDDAIKDHHGNETGEDHRTEASPYSSSSPSLSK